LKTVKDSTTPDVAAIKSATDALSTEIQKIGQYMNQNQQAGTAGASTNGTTDDAGAGPENKSPESNMKDAEFKEKK